MMMLRPKLGEPSLFSALDVLELFAVGRRHGKHPRDPFLLRAFERVSRRVLKGVNRLNAVEVSVRDRSIEIMGQKVPRNV